MAIVFRIANKLGNVGSAFNVVYNIIGCSRIEMPCIGQNRVGKKNCR